MAIPDYKIVASFRDAKSRIATMTFYSNALTDAAARTQATALKDLLQAQSLATVAKVELMVNIWTNAAVGSGDVEEKMTYTFVDSFGFPVVVSLPAFAESLVLPNTDRADPAQPEVDAFIDAIIGGSYVSLHDDDIVSLRSAVKSWRR